MPGTLSGLKHLHVLIVDDDETMRNLLSKMLQRSGAATVEAATAEHAWTTLSSTGSPINFVLCDWNMPGLSGLDFFKMLKAVRPTMPLIMITGRDDLDSILTARRAGVPAYIVKPVTHSELIAKINLLALTPAQALA
jgi:two-component system, chemotaxis family, chemotaxis protein CheY